MKLIFLLAGATVIRGIMGFGAKTVSKRETRNLKLETVFLQTSRIFVIT